MKIMIFVSFFICLIGRGYALPGDKLESISDPKEKIFSMVPPKTGGADCLLFRKKEEDGLKKFTQILNYLGCNIIKKPLDFCTCLDRLGAPPPLKFRDFPEDLVSLLGPDKIENIEFLKRKKKKFVSSLDVGKKKKSFQFDQLYCEALKRHVDQINKNTQLAISIMGRLEDLDEKRQRKKDERKKVLVVINSNKRELRKLKEDFESKKISKESYEEKKKKLEGENIDLEKKVSQLEKERDDLWERFQLQAHLLKLTKPLPVKVLVKGLEKERLKHLNKDSPKKEREYFYELVYLLGARGDDESVSVLNSLLQDKKYKIGPKSSEFPRVVRAMGIGRNPKAYKILENILKNDKRVWDYQKPLIQKSLGLMLGESDDLLDKKLKEYERLKGKEKDELLTMLTYVKHPRVGELLKKVKKESSQKSDYLEDLIERGLMRNSAKRAKEYLDEIGAANMESENSRIEAITKAEALLDVGRYDVLVQLIKKNKSNLGEDKSYFNGLVGSLVERVNYNSRFIKEEDRKKIGEALRGMENDPDPKISKLVKKTLLQIGDSKEINKVRKKLKEGKERASALADLQHIRAKNKYTQQEVIKDYRTAIKEEERPKKNETKKEKKERLDRVVIMKNTFLGQAYQLQKEAIKKAKETKIGKTLNTLHKNISQEQSEEDFYNDFEPSRPGSRKMLGVVLDEREKENITWGPRPKKIVEEKKEEALTSDDTTKNKKEENMVFGPDKAKLTKFLKLHLSTLRPLESFRTKRNIQREISKLKEDLVESKSVLASSFGSRRGEEFWKDNNIEDRLMDSRRDAFRQQKLERESERAISQDRFQKEGLQKKSRPQRSSSRGNFNGPSGEPRTISPKSPSSSSRPTFLPTNSSLLPGSSSLSRQTDAFEEPSALENTSEESEGSLSLTGSVSDSENKVKEENYRILLIKKSSKKENEKAEGPIIRISEKFLSLSQGDKDKVLQRIFKKRKEKTLILKTSSGILIRVRRNTVYKKRAPEETFHEKRETLGATIGKKEKRLDDLYSKLKSFLQKSKKNSK